jgi:crotonobetainyl-CoA:carnitine CoA-transferase CaiB-like acyl-CoA transferase
MSDRPLDGVTVLDFTHYVAGPACTRTLAGWGAEVIKVERPGVGDGARRLGPFPGDRPDPERSGLFLYLNTGKKSVTLDLKSATGRKIALDLAGQADLVVESFRPGVMASLGLDYATLAGRDPRIVVTSISNFGQDGPYRDFEATELGLYALSGAMATIGDPEREPIKKGGHLTQYTAGGHAFLASLAALWSREETGQGQHVDVSIAECMATIVAGQTKRLTYGGKMAGREVGHQSSDYPYGVLPCRDGYVSMGARPASTWPIIADIVGEPRLAEERFLTRRGRARHADEIAPVLLPWLAERGKDEIFHLGQRRRVALGYVATAADLLDSAQLAEREFFVELDHPLAGRLRYPGAPYRLGESEWTAARAPLLGEHTEEVLGQRLGYGPADLVKLRQRGVV